MKGRIEMLIKGVNLLLNGECNDEMIERAANDLGYIDENMYLTADAAAKYLGVSRDTFYKKIVPKYKLRNRRLKNNLPLGYYIPDLDNIKNT